MKAEGATKQGNVCPLHAQGIFQGKNLYTYYFCDERIGNKKTGQYDKEPGAFIMDNCFDHI